MDKSIRYLKGVGQKKAECLEKLGVTTVNELIDILPRRYENIGCTVDIRDLAYHRGQKVSVLATVALPVTETRVKGGMTLTQVFADDQTGRTRIVFFNNKFIKNMIKQGDMLYFYGKLPETGMPMLTNPQFFDSKIKENGMILPIYPLVSGLNQKFMRKVMSLALDQASIIETLPSDIIRTYGLVSRIDAVNKIHFPKSEKDIIDGRKRLIFEEMLYFTLGIRLMRSRKKRRASVVVQNIPSEFLEAHDFTPTSAQLHALEEIYRDLRSGTCMNRLLQGDVGSGKTLVAGQCAYAVIKSGAQAVLMVPTEVLANQHMSYFEKILTPLGVKVGLLTASVPAAQKRKIKSGAASGELDFIIGTHAVLQSDTVFKNLGLVITDEQHRFGVMQRSALAEKAERPHILVMSATPIPRTLALMLWGDLDLSTIDVLPAGRQKVSTYHVDFTYHDRLIDFIRKNIENDGRVYVVCPMIEDSEDSDAASALSRYDELCKVFGKETVGLVHGKMKGPDKEKAMRAFACGDIKILVSTTVIEVGVNVLEATLMIIENAERFGLSQLHQLRGRVGRGSKKSYCVLVSDSNSELTNTRIDFFVRTTDGFEIARKDLELRGPGNFFGKDQHGLPRMRIADMQDDMSELELVSGCATALLESDPTLEDHPLIRAGIYSLFESKGEIFN